MTKDELDAIRARYADEPLLAEMRTDRFGKLITVTREHPIHTLLAEVERLNERVETLRELADTAAAEQGLAQRRMEQAQQARLAAFSRGVAAMREAAVMAVPGHYVGQIIANLPEPEDK